MRLQPFLAFIFPAACMVILLGCSGQSKQAQQPTLTPRQTAALYAEASAMVGLFPEKALDGLASCPSCNPSPSEKDAAVALADPVLDLVRRANAQPAVDWGVPQRLAAKDVLNLRPKHLRQLNTLVLLRAESCLRAGETEQGLDDMEQAARLIVRSSQQGVLMDAMRGVTMHASWIAVAAMHMDKLDDAGLKRLLAISDNVLADLNGVPEALLFERERLIKWTLDADSASLKAVGLTPGIVRVYYPMIYKVEGELAQALRLAPKQMASRLAELDKQYAGNPMIKPVMVGFVNTRWAEYLVLSRRAALRAELLLRLGRAKVSSKAAADSPLPIQRVTTDGEVMWRTTTPKYLPKHLAKRWGPSKFELRMPTQALSSR